MQTALCILLALGGIALLYESGDGATLDLTGTILVMVSALSYAIYIVGVNRPALKSVATLKVTFYVLLFGLSLFFVRLDFGSAVSVPDRWYLWGNLVALAVFPTAISSHGYSGSSRTRDGRIFRRGGFRGVLDSADRVRNFTDYRGRESYRRGEQDRVLPRAFPQVVPAAALESERLP